MVGRKRNGCVKAHIGWIRPPHLMKKAVAGKVLAPNVGTVIIVIPLRSIIPPRFIFTLLVEPKSFLGLVIIESTRGNQVAIDEEKRYGR